MNGNIEVVKAEYRYIYIIENRNLWEQSVKNCDKNLDLVLCIDFGLFHQLRDLQYNVAFLDHLASKELLDEGNEQMNHFLQNWFIGPEGEMLLEYKGYHLGDALLLHVLNDVTYFFHFFYNIIQLRKIKYQQLFVAIHDKEVEQILAFCQIPYQALDISTEKSSQFVYSFPISLWITQAINRTSIRNRIADFISKSLDTLLSFVDLFKKRTKKTIFIQNYFPTKDIIRLFVKEDSYNLILPTYVKEASIFKQRRIGYKKANADAPRIIADFKAAKKQEWIIEGYLLNDYLLSKIYAQLEEHVITGISIIESIENFFKKRKLDLMIPITNLWLHNRLLMNYCRNNNIPVYMIINGLLNVNHWVDAHDSNYVNCYSKTIYEDYFKNRAGVHAIGDTRMDKYAVVTKKIINRQNPMIIIGAAGFDNIDLNSYLAFEFDFLFDILEVIETLKKDQYEGEIILKVRSNGYSELYEQFIEEYFPNLKIKVKQAIPFFDLIQSADLYISFYSQSILEAAALGIPTIYYKKDTQTIFRPYDGASELVTSYCPEELKDQIKDFYANDNRFNAFLDKQVLEKYVGFLDGKNLKRNIDFINEILQEQKIGDK